MHFIIFGDSITQGYFDQEYGGWVNRLHLHVIEKRIETDHEYDAYIYNLGISSNRSRELVARIEDETKHRAQDREVVTLIAIGVNDSAYDRKRAKNWIPLDEFAQNIESCVTTAQKYGRAVLVGVAPVAGHLLDPIPWFPQYSYLQSEVDRYDRVLQAAANAHDLLYISMEQIFGDDVEGKTVDGIHPNAEGHRLVFERVKKTLEEHHIL